MLSRGWVAAAAVGCLAPRNPLPGGPLDTAVTPAPPAVTASSLTCDLAAARWTLSLETSGWGSASSLWSSDGVYIEVRAVPSVAHAPDGTGESFLLTLTVVPDFRDLDLRTGTALPCGADPAVRVIVDDVDGAPVDCVDFPGSGLDWTTVEGAPPCPVEADE